MKFIKELERKYLPYRCSKCNGVLYNHNGKVNYVYINKKKGHKYICHDCYFKQKQLSEVKEDEKRFE